MTLDELNIGDVVWHKHLHDEIEIYSIHPSDDPDREYVQCTPTKSKGTDIRLMRTHPSMLSDQPKPPRKPRKRKATA